MKLNYRSKKKKRNYIHTRTQLCDLLKYKKRDRNLNFFRSKRKQEKHTHINRMNRLEISTYFGDSKNNLELNERKQN